MGIVSKIASVFSSGVVNSIEKIALEAIETDKETAEAKALWIKTLDPNGQMRRELSRFACKAYGWFLAVMTILFLSHSFGVADPKQSSEAISAMTDLFLPLTTAWGGIVAASFGVNTMNAHKDK